MKRALGANIFAGRPFLKAMSTVDQWEKGIGNSYNTRIFEKKKIPKYLLQHIVIVEIKNMQKR